MFKAIKKTLRPLFSQRLINILWHFPNAVAANVWYGFPHKQMTVIGVTGTNGKTTTTQMIGAVLREAGYQTAVASTIDFWIGEEQRVNTSKFTTTNPWQLQKFLKEAQRKNCTHAVIETASHALDQYRVWGIEYSVAAITNLTREHLDYHHTMDEYEVAKRKLFLQSKNAVVNLDMWHAERFVGVASERTMTYSTKNKEADIFAGGIQLDFHRTEFRVEEEIFTLHIPGFFNIENALATLGVARFLEIADSVTARALASVKGIPGRMQLVPNDKNIDIIIDYAVTPDAFEKLYESVLPLKIPGTKIIHVFGACGDRDRGKRPLLGEIAAKRADSIILTNEDPYTEDGEKIIDEIEPGVERFKKSGRDYFRIYDRKEAIQKAIELADLGDIVLVTGKGAETSMAIGEERLPWNEESTIIDALKKV